MSTLTLSRREGCDKTRANLGIMKLESQTLMKIILTATLQKHWVGLIEQV